MRVAAEKAVEGRWLGSGPRQVALKDEAHIMAWMLDPFSTPIVDHLPLSWQSECMKVIKKFYPDAADQDAAMSELNQLLLQIGPWGDIIERKQKLIDPPDDVRAKLATIVDVEIWKQKKMTSTAAEWAVTGAQQFPKLAPIALRLDVLAVQSADVERVCKAHKVVHSKARNCLMTQTVHQLLFTYVNLRLLNKCTEEIGDFLLQCVEGCADDDDDDDDDDDEPEIVESPPAITDAAVDDDDDAEAL